MHLLVINLILLKIEFEHKNDLKTAYKYADGKKVDGRRVLVDIERGRTVMSWRPRRIGVD